MPAKQGKGHKLVRSAKDRQSGKYTKQSLRTAANKKKHITKSKAEGNPLAGVSIPQKPVKKEKANVN